MQYRLLLILLLVGNITFGQTDKHVKVSGTKCSIVPPNGFTATNAFSGFQSSETGASIMINELPAPYQQLVVSFTAEALKTRGMTLISKQTIDLNNSKATLIKVSQPANGMTYLKQMLIFGDTKGTVLVNGIFPEASKNIEPQIKEALLSTVYNSSQNDNPLEAAPFKLKSDNSFIDAGLGATWTRMDGNLFGDSKNLNGDHFVNFIPSIGYRRHTAKDFMWRISATPVANKHGLVPWLGASIGKRF